MNSESQDIITRLKTISHLYKQMLSINNKMQTFTPKDTYKRKTSLPAFPCKHENEEKANKLFEAISHKEEITTEEISQIYKKVFEPHKPNPIQTKPITTSTDKHKGDSGVGFVVGAFFGVLTFIISIATFVGGDVLTGILNAIIFGVCAYFVGKFYIKLLKCKKEDKKATIVAIEKNEQKNKEDEEKYKEDMSSYKKDLEAFLTEYPNWRLIYLDYLKEEEEISQKLETDRLAKITEIKEQELVPTINELNRINNLISDNYLNVIDKIIDLIVSGRAYNVKEAINLYEDIVYRERQLQLQREQEAQRRKDEERRHNEMLNEQRRAEEQRQRAENQRREAEEKAVNDAKLEAKRKCHWCKNWTTCGIKRNPPLNCTGFIPNSTHQI